MIELPVQIQFALISHTNAGKTTLARTLIGIDVGEVRDAPHVTTVSESHVLLATPEGDQLQLWDTPGFGDSVRLFKRLSMSGNPIGWFLREIVDRYRDRPFWLSQQALRTARDSADVVLYLVNSSENPRDAGYLPSEMKILQWLGKPVVILLNQMGAPRPHAEEQAEQARWKDHLAIYPVVQRVLALDAFARCWVHERVFYDAIGSLIGDEKKDAYARLFKIWEQDNHNRFQDAMQLLAGQLADAARDSELVERGDSTIAHTVLKAVGLGKQRERKRHDKAMGEMMTRLNGQVLQSTTALLKLYRLDAGAARKINERVQKSFVVRAPVDATQAGLLGAVVSGAATGLSADLMAGGLTFGAGALVGGVVGAMTFAGAAWAFNASTDRDAPRVQFSDEFLRTLLASALLRYLAVAHFGRGRGNFVEGEAPAFWSTEVEAALIRNEDNIRDAWRAVRANPALEKSVVALTRMLSDITFGLLENFYPRR
ncbi:MAG: DUF3482 domain-containing protein [Herminiimonas sp.]|nr:DUF3482 domain-containing protein [Herminiimonas sp.]